MYRIEAVISQIIDSLGYNLYTYFVLWQYFMLKLELYDVNCCRCLFFFTSSRIKINLLCLDNLDSNSCLWTFEIYNWLTAYLRGSNLINIIQGPGIQKTFIFDAASKVLSDSHYSVTVLYCCFFLVREIKFNN